MVCGTAWQLACTSATSAGLATQFKDCAGALCLYSTPPLPFFISTGVLPLPLSDKAQQHMPYPLSILSLLSACCPSNSAVILHLASLGCNIVGCPVLRVPSIFMPSMEPAQWVNKLCRCT